MRFNNKPRRAVDPNIFRFGNALRSKTWLKCCLLRCMLSAGREVKMEIPICACYFNSTRTLCRFGLISRSEPGISSPRGKTEEEGWTWGAVQGVFAQNPDRIFVVMRGELPDVTKIKPKFAELENEFGMPVHLQVPGVGMYPRNASVGQYASPGEASNDYMGVDRKDYRWKHIITVYDGQGNVSEAWTQWDSLFKPDNPNVLSQGRVHKILISPYDPEKRVWAIDDGHEVIRVFSNDGKKLLQTIGTLNTTTERNAKMTGNTGRPSYIQKTGPASETFGRQTDIAWLPDGTFFVTDGYEETRVVKFDKTGKFLMAWGERGEAGGNEKRPNYFNTVHGIAIDNQRRLYINDRSNRLVRLGPSEAAILGLWEFGQSGSQATFR